MAADPQSPADVTAFRRSSGSVPPDESQSRSRGSRPEPPLTLAEAARFLNVSERWMRRAVAQRSLTFIKLGRQLRFLPEDLRSTLEAGRVESVPLPRRR